MIVHIVMFKFKDENKEANLASVKEKLIQLEKDLDIVKQMEVGVDFVGSERSYDLSLYSKFDSKEDLSIYASHEKHLEVVKFIKEVTTDIKAVDYIL